MTAATEAALYAAWAQSGASQKVLLALFEAGIVESGLKNLASKAVPESKNYPNEGVAAGDHDSIGVLQQRASWGSVQSRMNVGESAARFISKAKSKEKASGQTAGQLAQAVQVSAFPAKYDMVAARAQTAIAGAKGGFTGNVQTVGLGDTLDNVGKAWDTLTDPHTYVRIGLFVAGFILLMIAIAKMTGDNQLSPMTKAAVKFAVTKKLPVK